MSKLFILVIVLLLFCCKTEEWYYQNSFDKLNTKISSGDTIKFPFNGKSNPYQYWQGDLIAFQNGDKLIIREFGEWLQYNPDDKTEFWTRTAFDTIGWGLVLQSEVFNTQTDGFYNQVICKDTIIDKLNLRKCDYQWYHDNGHLKRINSLITFGNPGDDGKSYGNEIIFDESGNVISTKFHEPELTEN